MTMAERIEVYEEIEKANRKNLMRMKVKALHTEMVMDGRMYEARKVLHFLRDGSVHLWLGDTDWAVECALTDIGYKPHYSRNGNTATIYA